MKPKRYEILRGVENSHTSKTPVPEQPIQVWTLLDEEEFNRIGLVHWRTAFIEDVLHDWSWGNGILRFYGHSGAPGEKHDLVLVYEK